jgi:hypothetical protein
VRKLASADVASESAQSSQVSLGGLSRHPKWVLLVQFEEVA